MRLRRRTLILGLIALSALVETAVAIALFTGGGGGGGAGATTALPMHPVAGKFKPNGVELETCSDQACFEQAFGNIAYRKGPKVAMRLFDQKYGDGSDPGCHRVAHIIGAASLAHFKYNVARTFAAGSASCNSGYYHGVLERALLQVKPFTMAALARVAQGVCDDREIRRVKWLAYSCLHGLGHGLMITTGYDLPAALKICKSLSTTWDWQACNGGVFMENISSSYGFTSRWLKDDDLVYPCDWVSSDVKLTCYQLVTSHVLRVIGLDWEKTAQICSRVEKGWRWACFQSYGRDVSSQTHRDPSEINRLCTIAKRYGGQKDCIVMAAMDMTSNFSGGGHAARLCDTTSPRLRAGCYFAIGQIQGRFRTTEKARVTDCRRLTNAPQSVSECVRGATGKQAEGVTAAR
jgi:hypothetical protein